MRNQIMSYKAQAASFPLGYIPDEKILLQHGLNIAVQNGIHVDMVEFTERV